MSEGDDYLRLHAELDALDIFGAMRSEMLGDPDRAFALVDMVKRQKGLRNPGGFAVARWRDGYGRLRAVPPAEPVELPDEPPTLSAIEYAWSREPSIAMQACLTLMAAAVRRHGFHVVQRSFHERERFDDGE